MLFRSKKTRKIKVCPCLALKIFTPVNASVSASREFWRFVFVVQLPLSVTVGVIVAYLIMKYGRGRLILTEIHSCDACLFLICFILMFFASILTTGATVQRLHDLNMSGWWLVLFLLLNSIKVLQFPILLCYFLLLGCVPGSRSTNRFGD